MMNPVAHALRAAALATWMAAAGVPAATTAEPPKQFAARTAEPVVLEDFNRPFLFSYLSWQGKAFTTNGVAVLRGFNNQGGAGLNGEWNLADKAGLIPVFDRHTHQAF